MAARQRDVLSCAIPEAESRDLREKAGGRYPLGRATLGKGWKGTSAESSVPAHRIVPQVTQTTIIRSCPQNRPWISLLGEIVVPASFSQGRLWR